MKARTLIDRICEADKEEASVQVTLTGSPKSVQRAISQLSKKKKSGGAGAKETPLRDLAKTAGDVKVKPKKDARVEPPDDEDKGGKDDEDDQD